jgi:hypothetical protein
LNTSTGYHVCSPEDAMTRLALLALCACAPVPDVNVYVDTTDAQLTDAVDCPEPEAPACIPLPLYCGGYAVELCDDERGQAAYVPEATPSAFWCHNGDCSSGLTVLMQWCSESFE